jgi:ComF family protein
LSSSSLIKAAGRAWSQTLDFVYPRRCFGCGEEGLFICLDCIGGLQKADPPRCPYCWSPRVSVSCTSCPAVRHLDEVRSGFIHQGLAREAVLNLKYRGIYAAGAEMGSRLAEALHGWRGGAEVIVPVPLHRSRQQTRGYNQAARLAEGFAERLGLPLDDTLLRRRLATRSQAAGLDYEARLANVRDAFEAAGSAAGMRVLLVDDVVTTTATLQACAAALRAAGAASVDGVSFTREG